LTGAFPRCGRQKKRARDANEIEADEFFLKKAKTEGSKYVYRGLLYFFFKISRTAIKS